jgi:hypothetical protein
MRNFFLISLGLIFASCTTSFEANELPRRPDATVADTAIGDVLDVADVADTVDAQDALDAIGPPLDVDLRCGIMGNPCCTMTGMECRGGMVCLGGTCQSCPGTLTACNGTCVDISTNRSHCGNCGIVCADGQSCAAGGCDLVCVSPLLRCGDRCVNPSTNPAHCSTCNASCARTNTVSLCVGGECNFVRCDSGWGDCTTSGTCDTNLTTSVLHCGACNTRCAAPHAVSDCRAGACAITSCESGWLNCDGDASNGCEVNQNTSISHCGLCGTRCSAGQICNAGSCSAPSTTVCASGTADCVMAAPDCETNTYTDVTNCGGCGIECSFSNASSVCSMGVCGLGACNAGFADCNGMATDGCEVNTRISTANCAACGRSCSPPNATGSCTNSVCRVDMCTGSWADCDNAVANGCEANTNTSADHCGACGASCNAAANATATCADGLCTRTCATGFADCNGNPSDGCEVDVRTTVSNCGACNTACALPNAVNTCMGGVCGISSCVAGFADCDGNVTNGCEVNTQTSVSSCGSCTTSCSAANTTMTCTAGTCRVASCATGWSDCDGSASNGCEVSTTSNGANCGACGRACAAGQVCSNSVCETTCAGGTTLCSASCVNLQSDARNCGGCGRVCVGASRASAVCVSGVCNIACDPGFADCNGVRTDGCEIDLRTDVNRCGSCSTVCPTYANSSASCASGVCTFACRSSFANCDGNPANGCEVDLRSNVAHCGVCGTNCARPNAAVACTSSVCTGFCNAGYANCDGINSNGCEVPLGTDVNNCGACGNRCVARSNATVMCVSRVCRFTCNSTFGNCDGESSNGCEIDLNTSPRNCGTCGTRCSLTQRCVLGVCR